MGFGKHRRWLEAASSLSLAAAFVAACSVAPEVVGEGTPPEGDASPTEQDAIATDGVAPELDGASTSDAATGADADAGAEAGKACGAGAPVVCAVGAACEVDDDCEGKCTAKECATPTLTDGRRSPSLGETGIDCGGAAAPKCADTQTCAGDSDCTSAICSTLSKRCVASVSCRGGANGPAGLDTCGTGDPGAPGALVESCCRSLPLPERTTRRLDRYEITSGRVRAFIDALAAANAGTPNMRAFAKTFAAAHPGSQLADVATQHPGLLDVLPDRYDTSAPLPMAVHLGAFPLDPINGLDGCYIGPDAYGHATYWQPADKLKPWGVGYTDAQSARNGVRKYDRTALDTKPVNCVMPLLLAAFCAWDGGELARTIDYHEIWGRRPTPVGTETIYIPWAQLLPIGDFNWRNGHGDACPFPWPGCVFEQPYHHRFPALGHVPSDDDTPSIGAPGRFPKDITAITSASGEGWYDVGGSMLEAAWPVVAVTPIPGKETFDVCDVSASPGPGETACTRRTVNGTLRYTGSIKQITLIGYSFEAHYRGSEDYLASTTADEALTLDVKPVTFQYGKVGGRCAR